MEERRREWGKDHPLYVAAVLGQFPEALDDTLTSRSKINDAVERWNAGSAESGRGWVMGVDVARFGDDKTVMILRRGSRVEEIRSMHGADTMQVAGRIVELVRRHDVKAVFVDAAGVGGGVVDRLKELGQPVVEVQVGGSASNKERFVDLRAELFMELRTRFVGGDIAIPDDAELAGQLLSLRYEVTSSGKTRIESKSVLRKRGLPSPDKADALSLAFMGTPSLNVWI